ncbi:precorrin-2 C(20)-methyltransferase [Alphaproteobacteria bacterium]|jgi:precorrin-2/cobalt-factor-2 C20-methyltransferase|nr:precorrin-2 C(20)-methyltransferase [Candidatus Puniceispirillum sp.]MDA9012674.1 precorrin-2 C(20)-methyltransferase [Alphaproteobacteria bacterium]MDA9055273.1 precorrin-2 C(20)-methyltransferase [Alphaproteobacteria bacterium]MDB0013458.1 precorrin-2 C(20)-methyltransferase [Alphaproteobacteria bacterium]
MAKGKLYGIGTGPGDPELVTRKAWRLIQQAGIIAYLAPDDGPGFARSIVAEAIGHEVCEIIMRVPMRTGRAPAQSIYDDGAKQIAAYLDAGRDVVMLCEGDPLFYGSFMYVLARLRDEYPVEIVAGVTSVSACAASHLHPLVARNDSLVVLPAPLPDDALRSRIELADGIAIMKLGRHMPRIRSLLTSMGLADKTLYVGHASLGNELLGLLADAPDEAPYFSMLLIYKGDDPWIMR